jgi:hypothetical protein
MNPRRSASVICLATLALLLSLLTVPALGAGQPDHAPYGPVNGEGPWIDNPGGGFGDGGDPDEYLLVDHPDHTPQIISDNGRNLTGEQATAWDFLRFRVWWLSLLFSTGIFR